MDKDQLIGFEERVLEPDYMVNQAIDGPLLHCCLKRKHWKGGVR